MASYATAAAGRLTSARYRAIKIRTRAETPAPEIVESLLERCHIDDIETVQPMPGKGNWIIVFSREELVNNLLVGLEINGEKVQPQRVAKERYVYASVVFVPPNISNEEIASSLSDFAQVKNIKDEFMSDYPGIKTGKRLAILKPHGELPPYFDVGGVRASLLFKGRIACCPYCDSQDHLRRDFRNKLAKKVCFACNQPGHLKRDCTERTAPTRATETHSRDRPAEPTDKRDGDADEATDSDSSSSSGADTEVEMATDTLDTQNSPSPSNQHTPALFSQTPDTQFTENNHDFEFSPPVTKSAPKPSEPSPPGKGFYFGKEFILNKNTPVSFTAPDKKAKSDKNRGARHKMPPVVPLPPASEKRTSSSNSPRAGARHLPRPKTGTVEKDSKDPKKAAPARALQSDIFMILSYNLLSAQ